MIDVVWLSSQMNAERRTLAQSRNLVTRIA